MRRYLSNLIFSPISLLCGSVLCLAVSCGDDTEQQRQQATLAYESAHARVAQIREALYGAQKRADEAMVEIESLEPELRAAEAELRAIRERLRELGADVQEPGSSKRDDPDLFRLVQQALLESPELLEVAITAEVSSGSVVLRGNVPEEDMREVAGRIAASVSGVTAVENLIRVADRPILSGD